MEQRTIKFKAKCLDDSEWVEGYYIKKPSYHQTPKGDVVEDGEEHLIFGMTKDDVQPLCYEVDPSTVCQFTGLTNKDGKEIWEGDILSSHPFLEGEVSFYKGCLIVLRSDDSYVPLFEYINNEDPNVAELTNLGSKFDRKEEK